MTSDSDLAKFTAHEFGVQGSYVWDLGKAVDALEFGGSALYYGRSNGLKAYIFQLNFGVQF